MADPTYNNSLSWDGSGERLYETGVDHVVLYPINQSNEYKPGVAWNGVTSIAENPSGAEPSKLYADNIQYLTMYSLEEYGMTLGCYTYPDEFDACNGIADLGDATVGATAGQQARKKFGLCYRTKVGNDTQGQDYGYKLHLVYGCSAKPSSRTHSTVNNSPEAEELSFEITSDPVVVSTASGEKLKPLCYIEIDSTKFTTVDQKALLAALEKKLYGDPEASSADTGIPYLPSPAEVRTTLTPSG